MTNKAESALPVAENRSGTSRQIDKQVIPSCLETGMAFFQTQHNLKR